MYRYDAAKALLPPTVFHGIIMQVVAEGVRNGKTWKSEGHVSGDTIYLFGISGKVCNEAAPALVWLARAYPLPDA